MRKHGRSPRQGMTVIEKRSNGYNAIPAVYSANNKQKETGFIMGQSPFCCYLLTVNTIPLTVDAVAV